MKLPAKTPHADLLKAQEFVYLPCGFKCSGINISDESVEYGAAAFQLNDLHLIFRVAKITPTKIGQFVTIWKRIGDGPTQPYDASNSVDFIVVSVRNNNLFGQFIFPRSILLEKNIMSLNGKGGKRGIRVYPPWDKPTSKQAKKTQAWQLKYFLEILPPYQTVDCDRVRVLLAGHKNSSSL